MRYFRWLLIPFSLLYGLVIIIRNWLYDAGLFKSELFDLPVIVVGNLEIGGAGKSPMTEYLVRLFKNKYKLATLSRGYGRKTKGFYLATDTSTAADIGDEPAQFKHKFPGVTIAVCEKRVEGIDRLKADHQLIVLDDAYQHRALKPGFSILLFDYKSLSQPQVMLPGGNLREPFSGRWRADVLVISKCPASLNTAQQTNLSQRVAPLPYQYLFFSTIAYQPLQSLNGKPADITPDTDTVVFLLTGIANSAPLTQHLKPLARQVIHHNYPDHHQFSLKNILKLAAEFDACTAQKKIIVTTEKDAQRLGEPGLQQAMKGLPVLVLPIATEFLNDGKAQFDQLVEDYVTKHT